MKIFTGLKKLKARQFPRPVAAIGIFDGVHVGHQRVFKKAIAAARRIGGTALAVTFNPHPQRVLDMIKAPPLLVSLEHRIKLIEREGLDVLIVLDFNEKMARYSAADFIEKILVSKIGAAAVVIGADFTFGRDRKGDILLLRSFGDRYGFTVRAVPLLAIGGEPVSSTRIRGYILSGALRSAQRLFGRPVSVMGTVVRGSRRGRLLGYPTANIDPHHEVIPPEGVYAVYILRGGKRHKGVLNIGTRPTFEKGVPPTIEVHIVNFDKHIYGTDIEVIFVKRLREERRFARREDLIRQIGIDERAAAMVL